MTGDIPILFLSHLPLSKKFVPKFDNYCALLDRNILNKVDQPETEKIPQERKIKKVYPVKFFDRNNQ